MALCDLSRGRDGMNRASCIVRRADENDSAFLGEVMLMASRSHLERGFWDLVVPQDDLPDFLELLTLIDAQSFCHYSNFLIAESGSESIAAISGYCAGVPGAITPGQLIAIGWEEFGWDDGGLEQVYRRLEPYQRAMPEQTPGLWTIEWVATVPGMRRQGVMKALFPRILDEGRDRGHARAQITTFIGNSPAMRGYEELGFRIAEEKRHPDFESLMGAPGLVRLERDL